MTLARSALVLILLAAAAIPQGCSAARQASYDAAIASQSPPEDFWLSVTVLKAPADTASRAAAYQRMPVATRPARYIVEADRILRVATGSGASDDTFPPQTRQLTEAEFTSLWNTIRGSSLSISDHPAHAGTAPQLSQIGANTMYVVSFSAGGDRRVLAIDAEPKPGEGADDAKKLVEQLAALAWMK